MSGASKRKRKQPEPKKTKELEDDLLFEEESDSDAKDSESDEDAYADETADQKRIRLAKDYLTSLDLDAAGSSDEDEGDSMNDPIAHRLKKDLAKSRGRHFTPFADKLRTRTMDASCVQFLRGHRLPVTCVALSSDDTTVYSGSKDCCLLKWDLETGTKMSFAKGSRKEQQGKPDQHVDQVLSVAVSDDGRFVASGGRDKTVRIWDARTHKAIKAFTGHRDAVSCLAFRMESNTLFSGSFDRTVRLWNLDNLAYVEQLYGHQAEICAIDSLLDERAITVGRDKTARVWKIVAESQLLFGGGHTASIDALAQLTFQRFFTGSQDGSVALWNTAKKKPEARVNRAHKGEWVISAAAHRFSDVAASGSSDGFVRFWHCKGDGPKAKRLTAIGAVPCAGYVNAMAFSRTNRRFLVCGVGQEHRLGRWGRIGAAKNGLQIINLEAQADSSM